MTYITGIGYKRQREVVSQYAWNDRRILPPAGLPQGNIRVGYGYLETYLSPGTTRNELTPLSFPSDLAEKAPYAYYDRWTDMIDTMSEFVVMDQARSLASLAFWMAQGSASNQPWKPILGQISGLDSSIQADAPSTFTLSAPGIDLSKAQVLWDVRFLEPKFGNPAAITPRFSGDHWVEAEAVLPDGRRVVAVSNFVASAGADILPNQYQAVEPAVTGDTVALYHADGDLSDATGRNAPLVLEGNARIDTSNLAWMAQRSGGALRFLDLTDRATAKIPTALLRSTGTSEIVIEAMVYVNEFKAFDRDVATIFALIESYNDSYLEFREDKYMGPFIQGGNVFSFSGPSLSAVLTKKEWHHMSISISQSGYSFKLDGVERASFFSGELVNWGRASSALLMLGNFDGWIDEIVVRNLGGALPNSPGTVPPPNIVLDTSFLDAATYKYPVILPLYANASSSIGVAKVEFFSGATKLGEDSVAPYTFNWDVPSPGKYTITARATDTRGQVSVSAPATVTIAGSEPAPAILTPLGASSTGFRLLISGEGGRRYKMQASENGTSWADIGLVTLTTANAEFRDNTLGNRRRFYRAVVQP